MNQKKVYLTAVIFTLAMLLPSYAHASWWNPFSWNYFKNIVDETNIKEKEGEKDVEPQKNRTIKDDKSAAIRITTRGGIVSWLGQTQEGKYNPVTKKSSPNVWDIYVYKEGEILKITDSDLNTGGFSAETLYISKDYIYYTVGTGQFKKEKNLFRYNILTGKTESLLKGEPVSVNGGADDLILLGFIGKGYSVLDANNNKIISLPVSGMYSLSSNENAVCYVNKESVYKYNFNTKQNVLITQASGLSSPISFSCNSEYLAFTSTEPEKETLKIYNIKSGKTESVHEAVFKPSGMRMGASMVKIIDDKIYYSLKYDNKFYVQDLVSKKKKTLSTIEKSEQFFDTDGVNFIIGNTNGQRYITQILLRKI